MNRRQLLQLSSLAMLTSWGKSDAAVLQKETAAAPLDVSADLEAVRAAQKLPGLAAAAVRGQQIVAQGVAGVRHVNQPEKIALDDRFALGSCAKRMTVWMICRLVDAGKLTFDTTLAQALPDIPMKDEYREVTLAQLLTFKGGIQPYTRIGPRITPVLFEPGALADRRGKFIRHLLQEVPVAKPGTAMKYSNASYVLAAFVASQATKQDYESLVAETVLKPLAMTHAGFGRPRTAQRPGEPWLHLKEKDGYVAEPEVERLPESIMAPAGSSLHCSIRDFARFAACELAAAQGHAPLLKPATAQQAKAVLGQEWSGGGMNLGGAPWLAAGCLVLPKKDAALVVTINAGAGDEACEAVFKSLRQRLGL